MKAIITKYVGPSNTKGSRIIATDGDFRVIVGYDHALDSEGCHRKAAEALVERHYTNGVGKTTDHFKLIAGGTKTGYAFVWCES